MRPQSGRLSRLFTLDSDNGAEQYGCEQTDEQDHESLAIRKAVSQFVPQWIHLFIPLFSYLLENPKNPGSIKNQLIKPATIPIANTANTMSFCLVVSGLPPRLGKSIRKSPPTTPSGEKAAILM